MSIPELRPDFECPPAVTTSGPSGLVSDDQLTMSFKGITLSDHLEPKTDSWHSLPLLTVGAQCILPFRRPSLGFRRTLEGPRRSRLYPCEKMKLQLPRIDEEHTGHNDHHGDHAHVTGNGHLTTTFLTPISYSPVAMTPVSGTPVAVATGFSGVRDRLTMDRVQRRLESLRPDQAPPRFRATLRPVTGSDSQPDVTQKGLMTSSSSSSLPVVNLNSSTEALQGAVSIPVTASLPVPLWRRSLTLTRAEVDDRSSQQLGTRVQDRKSQLKRVYCMGRPHLLAPVPVNGFSSHPTLSRGRHPGRSLGTRRSYAVHGSLSMRSHVSTSFNFED